MLEVIPRHGAWLAMVMVILASAPPAAAAEKVIEAHKKETADSASH